MQSIKVRRFELRIYLMAHRSISQNVYQNRRRMKYLPTKKAMNYFESHYGPNYGQKQWSSIKAGLLATQKYACVLNTLSDDVDRFRSMLIEAGASDAVPHMNARYAESKGSIQILTKDEKLQKLEDVADEITFDTRISTPDIEDLPRDVTGLKVFHESNRIITETEINTPPVPRYVQMEQKKIKEEKVERELCVSDYLMPLIDDRPFAKSYSDSLSIFCMPPSTKMRFPNVQHGNSAGESSWYCLNGASTVPVLALNAEPGDRVLDLCSAPGGKAVLTMLSQPDIHELHVNDRGSARLAETKRTLLSFFGHLPQRNKVTLMDKEADIASYWTNQAGYYDKVLADVPCNTDREMLKINTVANFFHSKRLKERLHLPFIQKLILINACRMVRPGGTVIYSTCTLDVSQNDSVVTQATCEAASQYGIRMVACDMRYTLAEHIPFGVVDTVHSTLGITIVPNLHDNYGPLYISKLMRAD